MNRRRMDSNPSGHAYTSVAKWLHWTIAGLFLAAYVTIYYREWWAESDLADRVAIQAHFTIGYTIAALVAVRVCWRWSHRPPAPHATHAVHRLAVRLVHVALYGVMIVMPVTGYLTIADYVSSGPGSIDFLLMVELTFLKGIEPFEPLGLPLEALEDPAHRIHALLGAWIASLLIAGHAAAALYHHLVRKDGTLRKMLPAMR